MADRYQQQNRNQQRYRSDRQEEQFSDSAYQQGDDGRYGSSYGNMSRDRSYDSDNNYDSYRGNRYGNDTRGNYSSGERYSQSSQRNDYNPLDDYDRSSGMNRAGRMDQGRGYFAGDDYGSGSMGYGAGSAAGYGQSYSTNRYDNASRYNDMQFGRGQYNDRGYNQARQNRDERGFFDRAGDEIASWFGDEDAERRRREDHRGRGPSNYTRSDERILEDACDHLTNDSSVDASNIEVTVADREVTLDGTVTSRYAKRRAEDCVHSLSGVTHVQNNLRVKDDSSTYDRTRSMDRTSGTDTTTTDTTYTKSDTTATDTKL